MDRPPSRVSDSGPDYGDYIICSNCGQGVRCHTDLDEDGVPETFTEEHKCNEDDN